MKILQFVYYLGPGGAERFVVDLSNEFINQGHKVYLYMLRDDSIGDAGFYKSELSEKIIYKSLKIKEGFKLSHISVLKNVIKKLNPDIIHCHQNLVNYLFPLTLLFRKIKFFHTIHNDAPREVKGKIEYWIRRAFFSSQKMRAITISDETTKSFIKFYKTKKYTQIFNGRKQPVPSKKIEEVKAYFENLRKNSDAILMHIGRCVYQKNQLVLVNVINRLVKEGNKVSLLMIGDGFDSEEGKKLKSIASDSIIFLGTVHNVGDYYLNADAFCLSSRHEGMPITLIEALACGCTPICTPVGGIKDSIENGVTGFLSKSTSEKDYYDVVSTFLNRKNEVKKEKLISSYKERFSIEWCAKQHLKLFQQ